MTEQDQTNSVSCVSPVPTQDQVGRRSVAGSSGFDAGHLEIADIFWTLWERRWQVVAVTATFSVLALLYSFLATPWYQARVVMVPASNNMAAGLTSQFGGLASLAGIRVGDSSSVELIEVLRSRDLAAAFIQENDLVPVFFADKWDPNQRRWMVEDREDRPDIRDAVTYFHEHVAFVAEDRDSGVITLNVEWTDATAAAKWANEFVERANLEMQARARREAESNVSYLKEQLASTQLVALQQSVGDLLKAELQKLMLAQGAGDFAFRIVDRAETPKYPASPKRLLLLVVATVLGFVCAAVSIYLRSNLTGRLISRRRPTLPDSEE